MRLSLSLSFSFSFSFYFATVVEFSRVDRSRRRNWIVLDSNEQRRRGGGARLDPILIKLAQGSKRNEKRRDFAPTKRRSRVVLSLSLFLYGNRDSPVLPLQQVGKINICSTANRWGTKAAGSGTVSYVRLKRVIWKHQLYILRCTRSRSYVR